MTNFDKIHDKLDVMSRDFGRVEAQLSGLNEKLNGITEIRKYNHKEVQTAFQFIAENGVRYYKQLF